MRRLTYAIQDGGDDYCFDWLRAPVAGVQLFLPGRKLKTAMVRLRQRLVPYAATAPTVEVPGERVVGADPDVNVRFDLNRNANSHLHGGGSSN